MPSILTSLRWLYLLVTISAVTAWAQGSTVRMLDYHQDVWTTKQGAPSGISNIAQTRDGWIWLATDSGLYRFDGVRFESFKPLPGEALLGRRIGTLFAAPDGDLWISYVSGGLSRLHNGRLEHHPRQPSSIGLVYEIAVDIDGTPWVAGAEGLFRLLGKTWEKLGPHQGIPSGYTENIFVDQRGTLWAANGQNTYRYDREAGRFREHPSSLKNSGLIDGPDGSVWIGDPGRAQRVSAPTAPSASVRSEWINASTGHYSLFDREGNYWAVDCGGMPCRIPAKYVKDRVNLQPDRRNSSQIGQHTQAAEAKSLVTLEDAEGNIWLVAWDRLERFRKKKLNTYPAPGLAGRTELAADGDGHLWAYNNLKQERFWQLTDAAGPLAYPGDPLGMSIASSRDGHLLVATTKSLSRRSDGKVEVIPLPDAVTVHPYSRPEYQGVTTIVDDGRSIWVRTLPPALYRYTDGVWESAEQLGLPPSPVSLAADADGSVWLGYRDNLLIRYTHGKQRRYTKQDGLDNGLTLYLLAAKDLLVSSDKGTSVLKGDRFFPIKADDPEVLMHVSGAVTTPDGDYWLNGTKGLVHVKAEDWQKAINGTDQALRYELFDALDGYPGRAQNLTLTNSALLNKDGKLWVVGNTGVAWLQPGQLPRNPRPPPVHLLGIEADHHYYPKRDAIELPAGSNNLQIAYTALSYSMPERVRFKYRLEGVDKEWQDAGTRRTAYYTNLGPGQYRFRVVASNEDGVWNNVGDTQAFSIAPTFWQSRLFLVLCLALLVMLAAALYQWRVRQLLLQAKIRLAERERIARALHDTLLQGMQAMVLRFQLLTDRLPLDQQGRDRAEAIMAQAEGMLVEGRNQVMALRSAHNLESGLAAALAEVGYRLASDVPDTFSLQIKGKPRNLTTEVAEEAYNIAREALSNAFRHAQASQIKLTVAFAPERLAIHIQDNGTGIPVSIREGKQPSGRWGISGMRERAGQINAQLQIKQDTTGGTEVLLSVPGKIAYAKPESAEDSLSRLLKWCRRREK
ncbi:sensor histidine kinase [Chitinimonas naiadis]